VYSGLLEAAGVDTVKALRTRSAEDLAVRLQEVNDQKRLTQATPSPAGVAGWLEEAEALEPAVTH
jgi:hypothetical protein